MLIHHDIATWKADILSQIYDDDTRDLILSLPIPRFQTETNNDKIIWPYSPGGEFQVKRAYELLHQNQNQNLSISNHLVTNHKLWRIL